MVAHRSADTTLRNPAAFRRHGVLWGVLAFHGAVWGFINRFISPHPDYLDHWMQSRVFSFGYYEHPPMVAWVIRALTTVLGESEAGLEAGAILMNLAVIAGTYALSYRVYGRTAALFTLLFLEATVYFAWGTPMLQAEQPLMLAWLGALGSLLAYQRTGQARWLLVMGVCAGLGALSKYTMIVFYLGLAAFGLLVRERRREFYNPFQLLGGLIALAVSSPVIFWNGAHDWVSFRFQLAKASGSVAPLKHLTEFTLGYLVLFSLVLCGWGAWRLWRNWRARGPRDDAGTLLAVVGLVPLAFFSVAMLRGSFPDPKWANVGFLALFIALGGDAANLWARGGRRVLVRLLAAAFALNLAWAGLATVHAARPLLDISAGRDPLAQVVGWRETGRQVAAVLRERGQALPDTVVSISYDLAAQFALHLPTRPTTFSLNKAPRNLWSDPTAMTAGNTVFVCEEAECPRMVRLARARLGFRVTSVGLVETVILGTSRRRIGVYLIEDTGGKAGRSAREKARSPLR